MAIGLTAGLAWFAVVFLIHFIVLWTMPQSARPRIGQMAFLFGLIALLSTLGSLEVIFGTLSIETKGAFAYSALGGLLVYVGLLTLYLPFYYSVVTSLSLQTIVLLSEQDNGAMPIVILRRRFASRQLISQRLATMTLNGFLVERENGYSLTSKGRRVAKAFLFLKTFWRLDAGG